MTNRPVLLPYLFVLLAIFVVISTNAIPICIAIWDSLHQNSITSPEHKFIGFSNYSDVLTDPTFQRALLNTIGYVVMTVAGVLVLGIPFALWLRGVKHGKAVLLTIVIIPWAVPGTVNGAIWSLIFSPTSGFLNGILQSAHIIDHNILWLQGAGGLPLISLTLIWQALPIATLIILAGLENIPLQVFEAARIDGGGALRTFRSITLPLLRPALAIAVVQSAITAVNIFDQIYVLNGNAPSTLSIVQQTYVYAFKSVNFGLGLSAAMMSTIISLVISLVALAAVYREVEFT